LDTEDVVVRGKEMHCVDCSSRWLNRHRNLSIVNAREVACTSRLVFFRLEGERVRVHTRVRAAGVVGHRLHLIEVFTGLFLESVLTVEDKLELVERTNRRCTSGSTLFDPARTGSRINEGGTGTLGDGGVLTNRIGLENNTGSVGSEVPKSSVRGATVREAPNQFLDRVVERETNLLGRRGGNGIGASVLHLLDKVFVTLLGEATTFFGVEVHIVTPNLEATISVLGEFTGEVEVEADFVVLQSDERQVKTRVAVEEEDQWQEHGITRRRRHFGIVSLLGFIQVQLGIQTPPALVVFVNALTTNGEFNILHGTFSNPVAILSGTSQRGETRLGLHFDVHFADQITIARNGDRDTTIIRGCAVNSLFDVFHREVCVALVDSLEESNLGVTRQVDVLGAVSDKLHETTGHCESFCTIY